MKSVKILPLEKPIKMEVTIPGSKSYTNRALLMAAMTKNKVRIINPLFCDDTKAMINCLKTLGIKIKQSKNTISVVGNISDVTNKEYILNVDLSGTTLRFLLSFAAIIPGIKIITGKNGLLNRPIKDLVEALRNMGTKIKYLEKEGYPPIKVSSNKIKNNTILINGNISSQYVSSLLLIAPLIGLTINITGKQISKPYIDMTLDIMEKFEVQVENKNYKKYIIPKQKYQGYYVETVRDILILSDS